MPDASPSRSFVYRTLTVIGLVLATAVLVYLLLAATRVVLLAFAGVLLAVLFDGLAEQLRTRTGMPRPLALALVIIGAAGLLVGAGFVIGPQIAAQAGEMREALVAGFDALRERARSVPWLQPLLAELPGNGAGGTAVLGQVTSMFTTAFGALADLFIVTFVGIYLAVHPDLYRENAIRLFPKPRRERLRAVRAALGHALRRWLLGQFAAMAIVGILTTAGLLILGVPLALTLGLIAFLFAFIPYLGPIAATVPAVLVAFLEGPTLALWVLALYGGVQFVESNLLTPLIQKRVVSIPPALLILAQVLMGALTGVLGIALSTPLAVVVIVLVQMLYVEDVLGDRVVVLGADDSGG